MKKARIILIMLILILGIQLTYSRFSTKKPNGNVQATIGQAVVDIEYSGVHFDGTNTDGQNILHLENYDDLIHGYFVVKNFKGSNISDVNLKYNIYVVFTNSTVKQNVDCTITDTSSVNTYFTKTKLTESYTLDVNGTSEVLPAGTFKFSSNETLTGGQASTSRQYMLNVFLKESADAFAEVSSDIKIYCEAEQNIE